MRPTSLRISVLALANHRNLLRSATGSFGLRVFGAGLGFINGILLARLLGPAEFGIYAIVIAMANFGATIVLLGLPTLITRDVAACGVGGRWDQLSALVSNAYRWILLATVALLSVSTIVMVAHAVPGRIQWLVILPGMVLVPIVAMNQFRASILRGLHWVILADIPDLLLRPALLFGLLASAYMVGMHMNSSVALAMQLSAMSAALAFGAGWLSIKQPAEFKSGISRPLKFALVLLAFPFFADAIVTILEGQASLFLLGYLGGKEQAGLFQAANQLVGLIAIGLVAVNMPLQPRFSAAWVRKDHREIQRLATEAARIGAAVAFGGGFSILLFAEPIMRLYGAEYAPAVQALRILAIGQMFNAAAGSCGVLLLMTGHQRAVVRGTVLALVINSIVGYLLIPAYGLIGGALATTVGIVVWNVFYSVYAWIRLRVNTTIFSVKPA